MSLSIPLSISITHVILLHIYCFSRTILFFSTLLAWYHGNGAQLHSMTTPCVFCFLTISTDIFLCWNPRSQLLFIDCYCFTHLSLIQLFVHPIPCLSHSSAISISVLYIWIISLQSGLPALEFIFLAIMPIDKTWTFSIVSILATVLSLGFFVVLNTPSAVRNYSLVIR